MATVKKIKKAQRGVTATKDSSAYYKDENEFQWKLAENSSKFGMRKAAEEQMKNAKQAGKDADRQKFKGKPGFDANGFPAKEKTETKTKKKMKAGGMLKRADGSTSQRGLWDNLRANKGSGKKPTAQMLKQEKKIKAKTKK